MNWPVGVHNYEQYMGKIFNPIWDQVKYVWTRDTFRNVFNKPARELISPEDYINRLPTFLEVYNGLCEFTYKEGVLSISVERLERIPAGIYNKMSYLQRKFLTESIKIVVSDTGEGISKESLKDIFTPFFTTKNTGTGLGLPIVHQIVDNHRGYIYVESDAGKGTRFIIFLPFNREISV